MRDIQQRVRGCCGGCPCFFDVVGVLAAGLTSPGWVVSRPRTGAQVEAQVHLASALGHSARRAILRLGLTAPGPGSHRGEGSTRFEGCAREGTTLAHRVGAHPNSLAPTPNVESVRFVALCNRLREG